MSLDKNYFVIAGFDIKHYVTDEFDNWICTEESEKYHHFQSIGNIQLFDDPVSGDHLYFGWILATGDEYYLEDTKIEIRDLSGIGIEVSTELKKLFDQGIIKDYYNLIDNYQIIVFEECY